MPVLRSRQIPSTRSPQSKSISPKTLGSVSRFTTTVVEPPTPAKTCESLSSSPPPPYRRRSIRLSGDDIGPTPKRSRNDAVSVTQELDEYVSGSVRVRGSDVDDDAQELRQSEGNKQENGFLRLRSGARVVKSPNLTQHQDDSVRVSNVDLDRLIEKVLNHVQELGQSEDNKQEIGDNGFLSLRSGARVTKKVLTGGDGGNVDGSESKSEIKVNIKEEEGDLRHSRSKKKTMTSRAYSGEEKGKRKLSVDDQVVGNGIEEDDLSSFRVEEGVRIPKRYTREEKGKGKLSIDDQRVVHRMEEDVSSLFHDDENTVRSPRRYTREEKGKEVVSNDDVNDDDDVLEGVNLVLGLNIPGVNVNFDVEADQGIDLGGEMNEGRINIENDHRASRQKYMKDQHKNIARRNAFKYAHFSMEDEEGLGQGQVDGEALEGGAEVPYENCVRKVEDWPGPFSTAMKIIRDREKNLGKQAQNSCSRKGGMPLISWTPRKERGSELKRRMVPSLQSMCLKILTENVDAIGSLTYVPDVLRHKLCQMLCDSRRMNAHFFSLLLDGCPAEIRVADCSWLEEEEFESSIKACDMSSLTVLQLDLCGHCISDASLLKAIAPKGLPVLTTISLKGGCRISDAGLNAIVSAAPVLRSMNLSQCSLLTDVGIKTIADKLGSILHELYLDDCDTLDAMSILPSLKRLLRLEVLSLRGIGGVSDKFIKNLLTSNGQNMKELVLANCVNLTDSSLKVIAETCPQLCVLDLSYLRKLTDVSMVHLANGCRGIQDLRLCRNGFSDDAIAAFFETSGESLKELSLNNITKVGQNTTISLARRCKNLESLDLSWCRSLTDDALGLIADSCMSLRLLKIFGCTQITRTFIDGHSNPHLHVVGMKLTPILEHIKRPDFQQGPLYYSAVPSF